MKRIFVVLMGLIVFSCVSPYRQVREMPIRNVDLSGIPNGVYHGAFTYGSGKGFTYRVQTHVVNYRIHGIDVVANRDSKYARKAAGVLMRIVELQTPNVDAVSGATTTSKAFMKAVENSLRDAG